MAEGTTLMRRIARPTAPLPSLTPARALRLAATRGAERSIGLPLAVLGVAEEEGTLDELLSRLEDGLLVLALAEGSEPVGLIALDAEARAAAIEVQALGRVLPASPEPRHVTAADAALARPLLAAILAEVEAALADTALSGWVRAPRLGDRLPGVREATMLLADRRYRIVRLTLDLGAGGRQGLLALMIRLPPMEADAPETPASAATVADLALCAPTPLQAILHRLQIPLDQAEALEVGTVLPLPGVTVASVRIEGGGQDLGPARLGQVSGMRAIRIESPFAPNLEDLPPPRGPSEEPALPADEL